MDIRLIDDASKPLLKTDTKIPPFAKAPDVVLWNDRVFKHDGLQDKGVDVYRECPFYALDVSDAPAAKKKK